MALPNFKTVLKEHGYSCTLVRQAIYNLLSHSEPLSTAQLIAALPGIDRSSVYRSLQLFETLGVTQRLQLGWKYKIELSNAYQVHHHHATCVRCERSYELPEDSLLEQRLLALTEQLGFTAQEHQLEVRGICNNCKPKDPEQAPGLLGSLTLPSN